MNIFRLNKKKIYSPKTLRKHSMYCNKTPRNNINLEDFIGKFEAKEQINAVELKQEFKNKGA